MSEHIDAIAAARAKLVEQRRLIIVSLGREFVRGATEESLKKLVEYQEAIDALDAALADEQSQGRQRLS